MDDRLFPKIINCRIAEDATIDLMTIIIDSRIDNKVKIYRQCWITNTEMKESTYCGDGTRLNYSQMLPFSRVGKLCHLHYCNLGKHSYTGQDTVIMHCNIGSFTSISWGVTIGAAEHDFNNITTHSFLYNSYDQLNENKIYYDRFFQESHIGNDVWIGANATIKRGVTIGDGAVIGANSIVTKSIPPYAIVAGNPGKIIKYRFDKDTIKKLLNIEWWKLDDSTIKTNCDLFAMGPTDNVIEKLEEITRQEGIDN